MKKINILIVTAYLISIIFLIQSASALTANSSNYSVGIFGTGIATAIPSSTNYESIILSDVQGTTRNAESETYTTNIGFFEDTSYYVTVSITSYEIYPKSAVQGSIIRLSISALNSQSVWAVLTLPDSTQETIALANNGNSYYTTNSVGVYTVTFYANNSQGNLASVIDTFEITSTIIPPVTPPSGGGGGTTTIIEKCTYIWDCTSWSICLEGKQQRECKNIGNCTGTEGKPIETRECSDALFDVVMKFKDVELTANKTLRFGIDLIEQEGIDKIDVQIKYSIIDSNNTEIFSQIETRAIQGNLTYEKEISEIKLKDGEYTLRVDIIYGNQQRAFAEQKFEVKKGELGAPVKEGFNYNFLIIFAGLIFLLIILVIFILIKKRKKKAGKLKTHREYKSKIKRNLKKIKSKTFLIILAGFMLVGVLFIGGNSMTGFVVGSASVVNNNWNIFGFVLIIGMFGLLIFIYGKKIVEKIEIKRMNKHPKNSLKGLIKKKVYLENGDYIGKVDEILLGEGRVNSLKIKLNKKKKFKVKGITVKYKNVKSVGHIVLVDGKILEKLNI